MKSVELIWSDFKADIIAKGFPINYRKNYYDVDPAIYGYEVFSLDRAMVWVSNITDPTDVTDFETNYKSNSNKSVYDTEGKVYTRAESRPLCCTTYFTTAGDGLGSNIGIGNGNRLAWDASISDSFSTEGAPTGFKKMSVDIQFIDSIWLKEGSIYYMNCMKGSTLDMEVLCPPGGYYMYLGEVKQNTTGDWLVVDHYLMKHPIQDCVPMGDELNTESCSQELPSYLRFRLTITVPVADNSSYGYMELEMYRERTVYFP
jgi:hypothetical protein